MLINLLGIFFVSDSAQISGYTVNKCQYKWFGHYGARVYELKFTAPVLLAGRTSCNIPLSILRDSCHRIIRSPEGQPGINPAFGAALDPAATAVQE